MRDKNRMPGKITDDPQRLKATCDLIGGMAKDDKKLVAWIAAADVTQMEELEREDKSDTRTTTQSQPQAAESTGLSLYATSGTRGESDVRSN